MKIAVAGGTGVIGRYVVEAVERSGHHPVAMSRSTGVDLVTGAGLAAALEGADVIVDASNTRSQRRRVATAFFEAASANLQRFGTTAGTRRIVTVSIVGIDRLSGVPYYGAKLAQEAAVKRGPVPVTIMRSTQFHEFPAQVLKRARVGPVAVMPQVQVQTVSARAAGELAAEIALENAPPALVEVAGPDVADLVSLARKVVRRLGLPVWAVVPLRVPGRSAKAMRLGALTVSQGTGARIAGPRFDDWISGPEVELTNP